MPIIVARFAISIGGEGCCICLVLKVRHDTLYSIFIGT